MSAWFKLARRKTVDDWEEFRPHTALRPRTSSSSKLLVACLLFIGLVLVWIWFKPDITGTVAQIKSAISQMGQRQVTARRSRPASSTAARRAPARSAAARASSPQDARLPGPFEVYLLDGDRFIRVDASSRSVLLNTETGETTWIESDAAARR